VDTVVSIFQNYVLLSAITAWFTAQVIKFILTFITTGKFVRERLIGSGGMPSAHTALVCSATVAVAKAEGVNSPIFAVALILTCIVMYDAMGVRRAAGKQAQAINEINAERKSEDNAEPSELSTSIGHTPIEVLGGALLGILIPIIYEFLI
jgi:acid phosphatase family membrane protein YuiD